MEKHPSPRIAILPISESTVGALHTISREAYPAYMTGIWEKVNIMDPLIQMDGILDFSFLAKTGNTIGGYCVAFLIESEIRPRLSRPSLYVADMAIAPDAQQAHVGLTLCREVLNRAAQHGIDRIEFHARETTTYSALYSSSHTESILAEYGYELREHDLSDALTWADEASGAVEHGRLMSLQKIT